MNIRNKIIALGVFSALALSLLVALALSGVSDGVLLGGAVVAALLSLSAAAWLSRSYSRLLAQLQASLARVDEGKDLGIRLPKSKDHDLNKVVELLNSLLGQLSQDFIKINHNNEDLFESGAAVAMASSEVTSASDLQRQKAAIVNDSIVNLSSSIGQIAGNAILVRNMTTEAHDR